MKAISIGTKYEIYNDSLKTYDELPAKTYTVRYAKSSGFFLEERADLAANEKIYGVHLEKAVKVIEAFNLFERNLGVILSGDKGMQNAADWIYSTMRIWKESHCGTITAVKW